MNLTESVEGWRCGDGIFEVKYKLLDMFYHNYDPITGTVIYPDLKIGELFKARASILRWHEDPSKTLRKVIELPVFGTKDFRHHEHAMKVLGENVEWAIKCQVNPKLADKYTIENGKRIVNTWWEYEVEPELIRDDSLLEKFRYETRIK